MRKFNPEKELRKIQNGNRNKVLYSIILLLLIISIGSTYALYQVRYSKRIIYTKVAPFNIRDVILSVKVDGESSSRTTFPAKTEGLSFSGLECDKANTTTGSWNHDAWSLILDTKGPNKCTVFFKKSKSFSDVIKVDNTTIFNDDPGKNLRYAGASSEVNNYIWFNCDDYNNLTQSTASQKCEKWRIIGLFNNITKTAGGQENLVKIIRADKIGGIAWDSANTNNWTNASLPKGLNGPYLNNSDNGDWIAQEEYTGSSTGSYGSNTKYTYKGITSATINIIEQIKWNIGGADNGTASEMYIAERGTTTYNNQPYTWDGYIGLMHLSDYMYATTGSNSGATRDECLTLSKNYHEECKDKDWLFNGTPQWTITPHPANSIYVWYVYTEGFFNKGYRSDFSYGVWPSLYLKSTVKILSGDGSDTPNGTNGPYILAV